MHLVICLGSDIEKWQSMYLHAKIDCTCRKLACGVFGAACVACIGPTTGVYCAIFAPAVGNVYAGGCIGYAIKDLTGLNTDNFILYMCIFTSPLSKRKLLLIKRFCTQCGGYKFVQFSCHTIRTISLHDITTQWNTL